MIPEFERMIFDLNDGLHHTGILPADHYITGFHFIMNIVVIAVIMIAYKKIVIYSDWYADNEEFFYNTFPKIVLLLAVLVILLIGLYFKAYGEILFVIVGVSITLMIATRKEFTGFRRWLDEKFGWLY